MSPEITERRSFRMLPSEAIDFAKPALTYTTAEGETRTKVCHDYKMPEPELARKPGDPGWWTITMWLPMGATPVALVPDPNGPSL